jgi:hypothetical protein
MPSTQNKNQKTNGAPPLSGSPPPPPPPPINLLQRGSCLKLEFHGFGNSKKVNIARIAVRDFEGAIDDKVKKSRLKASKKLLDSPELAAINSFDNKLDKEIDDICLPFEFGIKLAPHMAVDMIEGKLVAAAAERALLVETFLEAYPERCAQANIDLNTLANTGDFPPVQEVRRRFGFSWRWLSFAVPDELKNIAPQVWKQECAKAADRMAEASAEIQLVLREAMAKLVEHMAERLTEKNGKPVLFFTSTLTNLTEFLANFDFRNITDDAELQAVVAKTRNLLTGVDLEQIRSPGAARARIQAGVAALAVQLDGLVKTGAQFGPGARRFRFNED